MIRTPAIALLFALAACAGPGPITLTDTWPSKTRDYSDVVRDWTRSGALHRDLETMISIDATFESTEWRAAYVAERTRREDLPAGDAAALLSAQKQANAESYEFELLVSTHDPRWNDLQKGERSMWRLALMNDRGEQVTPTLIKRERRPDAVVRAWFPRMGDFAEAYTVRFPRTADLLGNGARALILRVSGPDGAVTLTWRSR